MELQVVFFIFSDGVVVMGFRSCRRSRLYFLYYSGEFCYCGVQNIRIRISKRSVSNIYMYKCKILVNYATLKLTVFLIGRDESCRLDRFVSDVGHVRGNACFADFRKSETRRPRCGVGHC